MNQFDNPLVDTWCIHRFHCTEIHARNQPPISVKHMDMGRLMIASPPDEHVTAATDSTHTIAYAFLSA
jgi:hypothetical protein